ncbi:MAG TPA: hypothetical protein DCE56_16465, partial [Cyanobacteria bacterium UBA8553]|nr:hypothetical protein [Cyanobacteria bacterium UBA8553]
MERRILLGSFLELEGNTVLIKLLSNFDIEIVKLEKLELILREEKDNLADLILLDFSQKEEEGLVWISKVSLNPQKSPVIVVGETPDKNFGLKYLRAGVQDFLIKSQLTELSLLTVINSTLERYKFYQESQEKVQKTYNFLYHVFNRVEDPIFVKDKDHRWLLYNKRFCEFLQLDKDEILGKSDTDLFSQEEAEVFWKQDALVLETGIPNENEEVISFEQGTRIISTKKSRFIDRTGEAFVIGIIRDVTDYRNLIEKEKEAREEAEKANQVKDNFLAIVSHELKNPLTTIFCLARYIQQGAHPKNKRNYLLKKIEKSATTQERLIKDLLDASQIVHDGKLDIEYSTVNLKEIIQDTLIPAKERAREKSITLKSYLKEACIVGDPVRLQQIVMNLLSNAIKFTPKDGKISIRLLKKGESQVEIELKDTGVGISPEFLPQVFEFFKRENGKGTKNVKGLGLGLGIVKHLVESHNGTITASSPG